MNGSLGFQIWRVNKNFGRKMNQRPSRSNELKTFKQRIDYAMGKVGIGSYSELAARALVSPSSIANWLKRGEIPSGSARMSIGNALNVNYEWLRTGEGSEDRPRISIPMGTGSGKTRGMIVLAPDGGVVRMAHEQLVEMLKSYARDLLDFDYSDPNVGIMGVSVALSSAKRALDALRDPDLRAMEDE